RRSPRPSPTPALSGPSAPGPASAAPGAASSSGPSLRDLLHARDPPVEAAHDLAHERIILWAGPSGRGFRGLVLAETKVDLDVVAEPRPHVRHQLRRLLLRLLVVEPVPEPQHEHRPVHLGLRIEIGPPDGRPSSTPHRRAALPPPRLLSAAAARSRHRARTPRTPWRSAAPSE